ncbi:MAG: hypothetical protein ACYCZO_09225 [Daejeonella sp.]
MNTKTLINGLAGGVVIFLTGYVVYGMIMMNYFMSNMVPYPGLIKDPMELWAMAIGNIVLGILLAYILNLGGVVSVSRGASIGAIVFFLIGLGVNLTMYAQMNMSPLHVGFVDSICMAVLGALAGAVIGWMMGRSVAKN